MSKPEFVRRDNRLTTAPSQAAPWLMGVTLRQMMDDGYATYRNSLQNLKKCWKHNDPAADCY